MTETINMLQVLKDQVREELEAEYVGRVEAATEEMIRERTKYNNLVSVLEDLMIELHKEDELSIERVREIAENLGVKAPSSKYTVTVTLELVVEGVEAADEDEAAQAVRDYARAEIGMGFGLELEGEDYTVEDVQVESE